MGLPIAHVVQPNWPCRQQEFPKIKVVIGTHQEPITPEEFRRRVKKLFGQPRKTMLDMILDKDE